MRTWLAPWPLVVAMREATSPATSAISPAPDDGGALAPAGAPGAGCGRAGSPWSAIIAPSLSRWPPPESCPPSRSPLLPCLAWSAARAPLASGASADGTDRASSARSAREDSLGRSASRSRPTVAGSGGVAALAAGSRQGGRVGVKSSEDRGSRSSAGAPGSSCCSSSSKRSPRRSFSACSSLDGSTDATRSRVPSGRTTTWSLRRMPIGAILSVAGRAARPGEFLELQLRQALALPLRARLPVGEQLLDLLHLALRGQPGGVRLPLRLPGGVEGALERSYLVQEGLLPIAQLHDLRLQLVEIGQRHLLVLDLVVQLALALRAPRAV